MLCRKVILEQRHLHYICCLKTLNKRVFSLFLIFLCLFRIHVFVSANFVQNRYCRADIVQESTNTISSGLKCHPPHYGGIRNLEPGCSVSRVDIQASYINRDRKRQRTFCSFIPADHRLSGTDDSLTFRHNIRSSN
jgi:hypothetical protein